MTEKQVTPISDDIPLEELKRSFSETQNFPLRSAMLATMADCGEEGPVAPALSTALSDSDAEVRATALNLMEPPGNTVGGS